MVRTCPSCGTQARDGDRFCAKCGASLAGVASSTAKPHAFCTSCGAPLAADDRFCARCGTAAAARADETPGDSTPEAATAEAARDEEEAFDDEDFFGSWERESVPPDEARTEQVQIVTRRDTAVLPEIAPDGDARDAPRRAEEPTPRRGFPWGEAVAFVGAVAVVASSALPWVDRAEPLLPRDIAFTFVLFGSSAEREPSLGLVLLGVGMTGALVALLATAVPAARPIRRLLGVLALAVPALFVFRVFVADVGGVLDLLAIGPYVAAGGAALQVFAGSRSRR